MPQTLDLLDKEFADLVENVADARFAFWLGSGISMGRMPGLDELLKNVLSHLQAAASVEEQPNRFEEALAEILHFAQLSSVELDAIDTSVPVEAWPSIDLILQRLASNYSKVMNVRVRSEEKDYLLWVAAQAMAYYADPSIAPDVEHLCLGILAVEGVAPTMVTANWDGLIERAVSEMAGSSPLVRVCVEPEDLRELKLRASLFKIHGCAIRAAADPDKYRNSLIVRQDQIDEWSNSGANLFEDLVGIARTMPTLMIGLSGQDANIRTVFSKAKRQVAWPWPGPYVAHVFAEDRLGADQKAILQVSYKDSYDAHGAEIERSALLRVFGKPLLIGLVLQVWTAKLSSLMALALQNGPGTSAQDLREGIVALRNLAASGSDDQLDLVYRMIDGLAEASGLFMGDTSTAGATLPYRPISPSPRHEMLVDEATVALGLPHAAVALALVGLGEIAGEWSVSCEPGSTLTLTNDFADHRIFLAGTPAAEVALTQAGAVEAGGVRSVVVQSGPALEPLRRSPSKAPGRTGRPSVTRVNIASLLVDGGDASELLDRFRREATI